MKQKNLILMVVAVGCGLVAAFLTSQMSGKTQVEHVEVIVAARDLPVGTTIAQDDLAKAVTRIKVTKDAVPVGAIENEQELVGKRLARNYSKDEPIKKTDLATGGLLKPPAGMHTVALPMSTPQAVAGFVGPGSYVDILGTIRLRDNAIRAKSILKNMLVLAVDANTQYPKEGAVFQTVNSVTLAVNVKQAKLLELAKARGTTMTLLLRNEDSKAEPTDEREMDELIALLEDVREASSSANSPKSRDGVPGPATTPQTPAVETVKVPVAVVELVPGTELKADAVKDPAVFETVDVPKALVGNAITDLTPHVGKFLKHGLAKGQYLTEGMLANSPQPKPKLNPVPSVRRRTHDMTLYSPAGIKVYRYEEVQPGEWRLLGEINPADRAVSPDQRKPDRKFE